MHEKVKKLGIKYTCDECGIKFWEAFQEKYPIWNTQKYSLKRWLSHKVHYLATILRFLPPIWFSKNSLVKAMQESVHLHPSWTSQQRLCCIYLVFSMFQEIIRLVVFLWIFYWIHERHNWKAQLLNWTKIFTFHTLWQYRKNGRLEFGSRLSAPYILKETFINCTLTLTQCPLMLILEMLFCM